MDDYIFGIDLGTTNCCVAIWNKNLTIIKDEYNNTTIPSVVAYTNTTKYVGYDAKNQLELNPTNVFYEIKRLLGKKFTDNSVQTDSKYFSYKISTDNDNNIIILSNLINKNMFTPEEICSSILLKIKSIIENYLNKLEINYEKIKVIVTIPAYFNDSQRQATLDAIEISGMICIKMINEPTAAALAYGYEKLSLKNTDEIKIIVYDLGGGTLDVSLLNICEGVFEVIASTGNTHLGGIDFDNRLIDYCITQFRLKNNNFNIDTLSILSLQKLRNECENAKKKLTNCHHAKIFIKNFYDNINLVINLSIDLFNNLTSDLISLCMKPLDDILISSQLTKKDIDEIILVGGASQMPIIKENIKKYLGKEPNCSLNPDTCVAAGAAIQGYIIKNKNDPFSESIVLLDVTSLSLGVEINGGIMDIIIPRNSIIPVTKKNWYTNDTENETLIEIKIFEGERKLTKDNFFVGKFELSNLTPLPKGSAKIELSFSIDVNGIINVIAEDLHNPDNIKNIQINNNKKKLSKKEINKIIEESVQFELIDNINKEKKQLLYKINDFIENIQYNIKDIETKEKNTITNDIDNIKNIINNDDTDLSKILLELQQKYAVLTLKANIILNENVVSPCSYEQNEKNQLLGRTELFENNEV